MTTQTDERRWGTTRRTITAHGETLDVLHCHWCGARMRVLPGETNDCPYCAKEQRAMRPEDV